jgi:peptidoglycan/xylan/chitin deacetylase (PgdA/CDA1 family)
LTLVLKEFIKKKIGSLLMPCTKLLVFNFHQSSLNYDPQLNGKYIWSSIDFLEEQLLYISQNYKVVSLFEGFADLKKGNLRGTHVAITFDDGDISIKQFVAPLLIKLKIPATFFINTAYLLNEKRGYWFNIFNYLNLGTKQQKDALVECSIANVENIRNTDNVDFYYENYQKIEKLEHLIEKNISFYLSIDDLKSFDPVLLNIGLHGHEHQRFAMMPVEWQKNSLLRNIEILSSLPSYKPVFALPFGKPIDWNGDTLNLCKQLNLEIAFSNGGYNTIKSAGIERIPVDGLRISDTIGKMQALKIKQLAFLKAK